MRFEKIPPADYSATDLEWLTRPVPGVPKISHREMLAKLDDGEWDLWRLPEPAEGIAVAYPENGLLFVYALTGRGLFGSLTVDDLLDAASFEGLDGLAAEVRSRGMKAILSRLGFVVAEVGPNWTKLELRRDQNGRI